MTDKQQNDFERRYFDQVDQGFKDIKGDIRELNDEIRSNTKEIRKVNTRVTKLEDRVFPSQNETIHQLPPFYRDPLFLKAMSYFAGAILAGLIIFAAIKGIQLPKGLF